MSYSLYTQCYGCAKKMKCKDAQRLQEGINKLHNDGYVNGDHLGGGQISLQCCRLINENDMNELLKERAETNTAD